MADLVIIPAIGGIYRAFDNTMLVNMIITGPVLWSVPFAVPCLAPPGEMPIHSITSGRPLLFPKALPALPSVR
ncbi:hypothetical protein AKG39_15790 [Acetobacterium bakii]|uniref:Uncharacterized protein n=1 Tax=Acetobacterium bakii TaxID=52689 RepID=A0A0L6TWX2_9FIRM|nr:hypothetical protein [Acetobacterium bakii]KNZ40764.1 hypothetical protein AKG39_15790 [Acetobacterium bakii]